MKRISLFILTNIILLLLAILIIIIMLMYNEVINNLTKQTSTEGITTEEYSITAQIDQIIKENITNNDTVVREEEISQTNQELAIPLIEIEESITPTVEEPIQQQIQEEPSSYNSNLYKYYYYQLNPTAKNIYESIEQNIGNLKTGTYTIDLTSKLSKTMEKDGFDKLNADFQSAWDAIIMDRVELFYIDISKISLNVKTTTYGSHVEYNITMGSGDNDNYLEEGFLNEQIVTMSLNQVEGIANEIIKSLHGNTFDKIEQVHDWLIDNLSYGVEISGNNSYNIYGAFINKSVVCEGYAESFKYIMDKLGIQCVLVSGIAENTEGNRESHEWNYVQIDGKWYAIDVTWDDPIIMGGVSLPKALRYKYFLKGSSTINTNHFPDGNISANGMTFKYPNLEEGNYN